MTAKRGIRTYGERAVAATLAEYKHLIEMSVFTSQDPGKMTEEEKRRALRTINLTKEKRCGKIKGKTVADGSKQWLYTTKAETVSLTIGLEALFASFMIDIHEGRAIQTFDVPRAYIQTSMPEDKNTYMKFEGEFVDILCESGKSFK